MLFPKKLLKESTEKRIEYFRNYTVAHTKLKNIDKKLETEIDYAISSREKLTKDNHSSGSSLLFLYGPTGVGKTTVIQTIENRIIRKYYSELEKDLSMIPIVVCEAVAPDNGNFNWKDFYYRCMQKLQEPLLDHKKDVDLQKTENGKLSISLNEKSNRATYARAFEKVLNHRSLKVLIIDEAQHLTKIGSGSKLNNQLDAIKSFSNRSGVLPILVGTYELLPFRNLSAQLSRRSIDLQFSRYNLDSEEEVNQFRSVIITFQKHLPLEEEPDLDDLWQYLYERSIGCVGILKEWLLRSLITALRNGKKTISIEELEMNALSVSQVQQILTETIEGEKQLKENDTDRLKLQTMLGIGSKPSKDSKQKKNNGKQKNKKVGQRNPTRDVVGDK